MTRVRHLLLLGTLVLLNACSEQEVNAPGTPPPNVTVVTDLTQTFNCTARDCLARYRSFVTDHPQFAHPRPEDVVLDELAALEQEPLPPLVTLTRAELRAAIVGALNIDFMLDGLD